VQLNVRVTQVCMSTAEFAARPVADANPPVPICSPLWDEEALSNGCQSAGSTRVISVHARNAALKVDHFVEASDHSTPCYVSIRDRPGP
jgi:hypothetical protein